MVFTAAASSLVSILLSVLLPDIGERPQQPKGNIFPKHEYGKEAHIPESAGAVSHAVAVCLETIQLCMHV